MPELLTQAQVQAQFDAASEAGVSPCVWIPPTWEQLQADGYRFRDNCKDPGEFGNPSTDATLEMQRRIGRETQGECSGPVSPPSSTCRPSPFSDFSHTDPSPEYDQVNDVLSAGSEAVAEALQRPDV